MKILKSTTTLLILGFLLLTSSQCKKDNQFPDKKEELPVITQTGANTFGFLLNGEIWLPTRSLFSSNIDLSYDPNYNGGAFNIVARRNYSDGNHDHIALGASFSKVGTYDLVVSFNNGQCYYLDLNKPVGTLNITKIDQKFISGTFSFKLEKDGCKTINATEGRFDLKIE